MKLEQEVIDNFDSISKDLDSVLKSIPKVMDSIDSTIKNEIGDKKYPKFKDIFDKMTKAKIEGKEDMFKSLQKDLENLIEKD